jgi:hypothetical protein
VGEGVGVAGVVEDHDRRAGSLGHEPLLGEIEAKIVGNAVGTMEHSDANGAPVQTRVRKGRVRERCATARDRIARRARTRCRQPEDVRASVGRAGDDDPSEVLRVSFTPATHHGATIAISAGERPAISYQSQALEAT